MDGRILADLFATRRALRVDQRTIWRAMNQDQRTASVVDFSNDRDPEQMRGIYLRAYDQWEQRGTPRETRKMWYDPLLMTLFLENTHP